MNAARIFRHYIVAAAIAVVWCGFAAADEPANSARQVNFLTFGDWGAGTDAQERVAQQMATLAAVRHPAFDAALVLGDNFYVDLPRGSKSTQWQTLFERMYDRNRMPFPFYALLGNHDYHDSAKVDAELGYGRENPESRWKMPSRWYRLDFPEHDPLVTVLMLDSNWRDMPASQWKQELDWLTAELQGPHAAPWLVCAAHHPLFNDGRYGDDPVLLQDWGPLFQRAKVDLYLAGHDHNLQHLEIPNWPTSFLIAGGGGQDTYRIRRTTRGPFAQQSFGAVAVNFTPESATVDFYDDAGKLLHHFQRAPNAR